MSSCPSCRQAVQSADVFCQHCGYDLRRSQAAAPSTVAGGPPLARSIGSWRTIRWVLLTGCLLFTAGTLCGVLANPFDRQPESARGDNCNSERSGPIPYSGASDGHTHSFHQHAGRQGVGRR